MKKTGIFVAAIALLALAFVFGVQLYRSEQAQQASQTTMQNRDALVRFHSPSMGNASAPVHIVEFLDPACEGCRAFYPFVKKLMADNPENIRLTVRYAPFHKGADDIVRALEASRKQGKYWQALEAMFASQPEWAPDHTAHLDLAWPHLQRVGLDMERLKEDMKSPDITKIIQQDMEDVKALKVSKTPEFFVNGKPLPSFGPEQLQKMVRDELASAQARK